MVITVVWETWLKAGAEAEGLRLTRQIWSDMRVRGLRLASTAVGSGRSRPPHSARPMAEP